MEKLLKLNHETGYTGNTPCQGGGQSLRPLLGWNNYEAPVKQRNNTGLVAD
ncbi:MAG: hypothetical protein LBG24_06440 [Treponema sp.]|nr:hypothetical protein [Treponema sp.]